MTGATVYLEEFDPLHRATGHVHRFYMCTHHGYSTRRGDALGDLSYVPLVEVAGDLRLAVTSYGETAGDTKVDVGETILSNRADWRLPFLVRDLTAGQWITITPGTRRPLSILKTDYVLGGRPLAILSIQRHAARATAKPLLTARTEMPEWPRSQVRLRPRDRALDFDAPVLAPSVTYGGTGGMDGVADLKDRTKEGCLGHVLSLEPTYLGEIGGKPTFSGNGGKPIEGYVVVRDAYAPLTEVTTGTPGGEQWRQDRSTGILTVGGSYRRITCEVKGDKSGGVWRSSVAALIRWGAVASGVLTEAEIEAADFDALAAAWPHPVGLWLPPGDTTTWRAAFDQLARSILADWLFSPQGKLRLIRIGPPAGPAKAVYRAGLNTPGLTARSATARQMPAKAALVRWGRNYSTASDDEVADIIKGDVRAFAGAEWREARTTDDAGVVAAYGALARVVERDTLLSTRAGADAVAAALRADAAQEWGLYDLPTEGDAADIALGDVVTVEDDIPGFETGRLATVLGRAFIHGGPLNSFVVRG